MMVARGARILAWLVLTAGVAGCATQKAEPPPLLDLSAFHCRQAPVLAGAPKLAYDPRKGESKTTADLTAASSCFRDSVGPSLYLAYELPSLPPSYLVRVDSEPQGATLLALRVLLYGSDGSLTRELSRRQIVFRGSDLSVIFRGHADERYLVVASDPAAVGRQLSQVRDATQGAMMAAYPFYFSVYSGTDATVKNTLSQNGHITISLEPIRGK